MTRRIIALTVNAALGLGLALFFLFFVGIAPVFANTYEGTHPVDTTRDFVLIILRGSSTASVHFEDEASCKAVASQVDLIIPGAYTICAGESE